jgi:hypothetical protein
VCVEILQHHDRNSHLPYDLPHCLLRWTNTKNNKNIVHTRDYDSCRHSTSVQIAEVGTEQLGFNNDLILNDIRECSIEITFQYREVLSLLSVKR